MTCFANRIALRWRSLRRPERLWDYEACIGLNVLCFRGGAVWVFLRLLWFELVVLLRKGV
jgi:hypothetical protein